MSYLLSSWSTCWKPLFYHIFYIPIPGSYSVRIHLYWCLLTGA